MDWRGRLVERNAGVLRFGMTGILINRDEREPEMSIDRLTLDASVTLYMYKIKAKLCCGMAVRIINLVECSAGVVDCCR